MPADDNGVHSESPTATPSPSPASPASPPSSHSSPASAASGGSADAVVSRSSLSVDLSAAEEKEKRRLALIGAAQAGKRRLQDAAQKAATQRDEGDHARQALAKEEEPVISADEALQREQQDAEKAKIRRTRNPPLK